MCNENKEVSLDEIRKKLKDCGAENSEFHMKEMRKKLKWYKKSPWMMKYFAVPASAFVSYVTLAIFYYQYLQTGLNSHEVSSFMIITGLMCLISFRVLTGQQDGESFKESISPFLFLDFKERYLNILDECYKDEELSLDSIKIISEHVPIDEFKRIINDNNGKITYGNIFKSSISNMYYSKKQNEYLTLKKAKADVLIDKVYDEKKAVEK